MSDICTYSQTILDATASNLGIYEPDSLHPRIAGALQIRDEDVLSHSNEGRDVTGNRSNRVWLRFGARGDTSNLVRGDASHSNGVFSRLGGYGDRILGVTCESFLSKK